MIDTVVGEVILSIAAGATVGVLITAKIMEETDMMVDAAAVLHTEVSHLMEVALVEVALVELALVEVAHAGVAQVLGEVHHTVQVVVLTRISLHHQGLHHFECGLLIHVVSLLQNLMPWSEEHLEPAEKMCKSAGR